MKNRRNQLPGPFGKRDDNNDNENFLEARSNHFYLFFDYSTSLARRGTKCAKWDETREECRRSLRSLKEKERMSDGQVNSRDAVGSMMIRTTARRMKRYPLHSISHTDWLLSSRMAGGRASLAKWEGEDSDRARMPPLFAYATRCGCRPIGNFISKLVCIYSQH